MSAGDGMRLLIRPGHPDFLDLPWDQPLVEWRDDRIVEVARGLHRHVVRFVDYDGALYALKQMPARLAEREYRLLRRMAEASLPAVEVVGVVSNPPGAAGADQQDVLITRYLDYSLPYRVLFVHRFAPEEPPGGSGRRGSGGDPPGQHRVRTLAERLLDALAMLLTRMHLAGFFWGDCSLSNTLFRRDAGSLAAYTVDVETGEWHAQLTEGQRQTDVEIACLNVAGGLYDLQAEFELPPEPDPVEAAQQLRERYGRLWGELTHDEVIGPDERYRIEARLRRLNELGFDVDEVELVATDRGDRLLVSPVVTEQGHHRHRLMTLTGLQAQENQARSLLNDLANFRAAVEREHGRPLPDPVAAYRWLTDVFEPTVAAVPDALRAKREPAEVFHEVTEHKWFLSEEAGHDVGLAEAVASYVSDVLPAVPDERTVLARTKDTDTGYMGYG